MISGQDVDFAVCNVGRKTIVKHNKCYNCEQFQKMLDGNPKSLIKKLRMNPDLCICRQEVHIWVYDKRRGKPKRFNTTTCLGRLLIIQNEEVFESHSNIYRQLYLNKGLGLYLYSLGADWCARRGVSLHSSIYPSQAANRVWRSTRLRKNYCITRIRAGGGTRWCMIPKGAADLK